MTLKLEILLSFISTPLGMRPGGAYIHISRTFNNYYIGFIAVWMKLMAFVGGITFMATSFGEYLTFFIDRFKDQFITGTLNVPKKHRSTTSLTIDTPEDFTFVKKFLEQMNKKNLKYTYEMSHIINFLKKNNKKISKRSRKLEKINTELNWEKVIN